MKNDDLDEWLKNKRKTQYLVFWEEFKHKKGNIINPQKDCYNINQMVKISDVLDFKNYIDSELKFLNNAISYLYVTYCQDEDFKLLEVAISNLLCVKLTCNNRIRHLLTEEDNVIKKIFNSFSNF